MRPRLQSIIRVDGYTIGRCGERLYVIDPNGLMAWPDADEESLDTSLGFPQRIPRPVADHVNRMLRSTQSALKKISFNGPGSKNNRLDNEALNKDFCEQEIVMNMNTNTAWLFPGQGSQEIAMGAALKKFSAHYESAFDLAEEYSGLALRDCVARGPETTLTMTEYAQPAIIAVSVAYTDFLREHGMRPNAVAGHSLGEYGALYAAGVLSAKDTLRLAASRGKLMAESAEGTMVAVKGLNAADVQQVVEATGSGNLVIANLNTPEQTVVSGDIDSVERFEELLQVDGHRYVRLNVSGAWHSPLVSSAAEAFCRVLESATWMEPEVAVFLGAVGEKVNTADEIRSIMKRQITSPVHWFKTIEAMLADGITEFVEVGPGKILRGLMRKAVSPGIKYDIRGVDNKRYVKALCESGGSIAS